MMEDAGRGWRRVVASPKPLSIIECDTVKVLLEAGHIPVAAGGGGIAVAEAGGNQLKGAPAVVDKDFAAAKLAEMLDADMLVILTSVEKVAIKFGKPGQEWLSSLTIGQAGKYIEEGHFAKGSMLPKVEAAIGFARSKPGRKSLITLLTKAKEGLAGETGTVITS
jgi:carbamate kinase